ncbi:hydrolase, alpha/beta fold family protein [Pseudooceanicola batsensis HTCC2597]|uniref:Hydrolase, alpha/beta fold family protein n=1 Tax=Pseudooceanicola batsensis (strain ATCC BAA-863 / DSM 15984 / KCTC 12145 / HTCC2597) TaxID=252305 RepID=A3TXC8_PSEBH|nr:alpha/beta fold hydrolase [Pseudooceanicola batsensis]EAQ03488.1 hydrolase, alpha/beta fold family protein [Pseudooceanicola batsensis HTCC2597]
MSPDQIILTVVALLTSATDPAFDRLTQGGHDARYPVTVENCPRPIGPLEVEGKTVICGRVAVPERHGTDSEETIPLAFAVLKSRSAAPAPDPVIYLHGGPGGHTVQDIPFNADIFDFLRDRRDIVLFDQRGSGISDRTIACYNELAEDFLKFAEPDEETMFGADEPLAKCLAETVAAGTDLAPYNTTQSAKDVRAIMHALGYPQYNAFGISYGTKLGQELLRAAPEGLRSVVIDSISRVDNPAYDTNGVPVDQALGWVVDYCMADTDCAAAYPDLEATVHAAGKRLTEKPALTMAGEALEPSLIVDILELSNKRAGPFTAYLPQVFTELAAGKTATLEKLVTGGFNPTLTPEVILSAYGAGLDEADRTLAEVALMQADRLRGDEAAAAKLLTALSDDLSAAGAARTEALLDAAMSDVAATMEPDALLAFLHDYVLFVGQTPDRDRIRAFLATHIPEAERPRLMGLLAAMTDRDVAAFYERARMDSANLTAQTRMMFTLGLIACQEDYPFNSRAGYDAVAATYRFPAVDAGVRDSTLMLYDFCDLFDKHPREGYHEPVVSEIPVLAMAGTKDTQTNPDAAEMVVRTLSHGQAVLFPEAGHAVIQFSQCARDVAVGFLENPSAPVNAACTESLKPDFYLPPQTD